MLVVETYTAPDAFGGIGLYASKFIAAGTVIWRYRSDIDIFYPHQNYVTLPQVLRDKIGRYVYPAIVGGIAGVMYSRDKDRFTNHSLTPNTGEATGNEVVALSDIQAGEEITANYFEFIPGGLPDYCFELPNCCAFLLADMGGVLAAMRKDERKQPLRSS